MKLKSACSFVLLISIVCFGAPAIAGDLVIAGTGDSQALLRHLSALYEKSHPQSHIVVPDSVGSGGGIKAVISGSAGLGRTARALKAKEQGNGMTEIPFAVSPVVFSANPSAAEIGNITSAQIIDIYNGTIGNWQELGGDDHKIYPVDREPGDSSRFLLENRLKSTTMAFKDIQSKGKVFFSTPETADAIARHAHTIGYLPLSIAREVQLHIFSLDGIFPSAANIENGTYPLVITFYLIKPAEPSRLAEDFISFLQEDESRRLMLAQGVVPLKLPHN